jgi:oleate hydratase
MRAHIVGGGFGGLAAAAYLILHAEVSGQDITIYEADEQMGGGFLLDGNAESGYILPTGALFDKRFPCAYGLLEKIVSATNPPKSVKEELLEFNNHNNHDWAHIIIDRNGDRVHDPRFGLSLRDGLGFLRLLLTPECMLDKRRIDEFFSEEFFSTEFWLLWSTIMWSFPEHSAMEFRRYIKRTLPLFPHLSDLSGVLRTPRNQHQSLIEPLCDWLCASGVNWRPKSFVRDIGFAPSPDRITVNRLDCESNGEVTPVPIGPEDLVLVTTGSQAADLSVGGMKEAPRLRPRSRGQSSHLWKRLAKGRTDFGSPGLFFDDKALKHHSRAVTFTITTAKGNQFIGPMSELAGGSKPGSGGMVTLKDSGCLNDKDSGWLLSFAILNRPEVWGQPDDTDLVWGWGMYPENRGRFVPKPMAECTGEEILKELLQHLSFDKRLHELLQQLQSDKRDAMTKSPICIPCDLPYVNNVWMPRSRTDRPRPVPKGATNLGLLGQYVEVPQDVTFTIEYSARTAWEAIHLLLQRGPAPPPVYQGDRDPKALFNALKVFVGR